MKGFSRWLLTSVRRGYVQECPNLGKPLTHLSFTLGMENPLMDKVLDDKQNANAAAKVWLKAHPQVLDQWLASVTSRKGKPAVQVAQATLAP